MAKYMVEDILKHSIEIEEAGQKFYSLLADRLNDAKLKNIFTVMARQETGHYEFYKNLLEQLLETQAIPAAPAPPVASETPAETTTAPVPDTPVTSEAHATSIVPETSATPVTPETSAVPETQAEPVTPIAPEKPVAPEIQPSDTELFDYNKQRLLEDRIFNRLDVVQKTPKIKTLGDALAFMIDTEIDVVDYFENARKLINPQGQVMMQKIINEEKLHVKQLLDLRKHYQSVILK